MWLHHSSFTIAHVVLVARAFEIWCNHRLLSLPWFTAKEIINRLHIKMYKSPEAHTHSPHAHTHTQKLFINLHLFSPLRKRKANHIYKNWNLTYVGWRFKSPSLFDRIKIPGKFLQLKLYFLKKIMLGNFTPTPRYNHVSAQPCDSKACLASIIPTFSC